MSAHIWVITTGTYCSLNAQARVVAIYGSAALHHANIPSKHKTLFSTTFVQMLYTYFAFTDGYNRMSFSLQRNENTSIQWSTWFCLQWVKLRKLQTVFWCQYIGINIIYNVLKQWHIIRKYEVTMRAHIMTTGWARTMLHDLSQWIIKGKSYLLLIGTRSSRYPGFHVNVATYSK